MAGARLDSTRRFEAIRVAVLSARGAPFPGGTRRQASGRTATGRNRSSPVPPRPAWAGPFDVRPVQRGGDATRAPGPRLMTDRIVTGGPSQRCGTAWECDPAGHAQERQAGTNPCVPGVCVDRSTTRVDRARRATHAAFSPSPVRRRSASDGRAAGNRRLVARRSPNLSPQRGGGGASLCCWISGVMRRTVTRRFSREALCVFTFRFCSP
jgi:hypothetical protein